MNEKAIRKNQLVFLMAFLFFLSLPFLSQSVDISVERQVGINALVSVCDNDGICEPANGENAILCPLDCLLPAIGIGIIDIVPPIIFNLLVSKITFDSVIVSWDINEQALCEISWGENRKYDKGNISETGFSFKHSIQITELSSATFYYFKVKCQDTSGNKSEKEGNFITLSAPDITPPTNISNFEAIPGDSQITFKWQNPPDPDFKAVKIMRSEKFYPSNLLDGILVYDGKGTSFLDKGLKNGVRHYYTAFAYDEVGNYASGAIASAVPQKPLPPEVPPPEIPPPPEEIPPTVPPPPEIEKLILEDFQVIQEGKKISLEEGIKIKTESGKPLTISIPYEKVPEVLKTIMVTIEKPARLPDGSQAGGDEKLFSFLLRINKEKTAYLATLMPPEELGDYSFTITVLDYKNQALKRIPGQLEVFEVEQQPVALKIPWYKKIFNSILNWFQSIWQVIKNFFRKIF